MEFYLKLVKQESYSKRELDRQISASFFERTMIGNSKGGVYKGLLLCFMLPYGLCVPECKWVQF
jgi:hypothetical protein